MLLFGHISGNIFERECHNPQEADVNQSSTKIAAESKCMIDQQENLLMTQRHSIACTIMTAT